jgi:hypothetical protein
VKALTLVNVLDVRQGDGTYATSLAPSLLLEALSFIVDFHRDDTVLEFFEVRRILEPAATGAAAVRMSAEEKAELGQILDAVTADSPVEDFVATDLEFHKKIALGSGNSVLASLVDNMSLPTARARVWRGMTEPSARWPSTGPSTARSWPATPTWPGPGPRCTSPGSSRGCAPRSPAEPARAEPPVQYVSTNVHGCPRTSCRALRLSVRNRGLDLPLYGVDLATLRVRRVGSGMSRWRPNRRRRSGFPQVA